MTGINVIGMPHGLHGLGLELRDKVLAMRSAGIDVCIIEQNFSSLNRTYRDPELTPLISAKPRYDINLICHNLPATGIMAARSPELFEGRYNIGAPYWEFPELPANHAAALPHLQELWVSNQFLANVFAGHTDAPVVQMPLHISKAEAPKKRPEQPLTFGYIFDFNSMSARKDPTVLLLGFLEAFSSDPNAKVRLRIKYSLEASHLVRQRDVDRFFELAKQDPRIELISGNLSQNEMSKLLDSFDVYVSPHRAEGLGRGIVEAMASSRAVIATGYSGPAEFLTDQTAIAIEHIMGHVGADTLGDIKSHFTWAICKLDSLVSAFKALENDPKLVKKIGKGAGAFIDQHHGSQAHGHACLERLKSIEAAL